MSNEADVIAELNRYRNEDLDRELEEKRLVACYLHCTPDERRIIWAVLNKYAPLITRVQPQGTL